MQFKKLKSKQALDIDSSYINTEVSYDKKKGFQISIYQITTLPLRLCDMHNFSFPDQCLSFTYKCSYYIAKIGLIIGQYEVEIRNIKLSDDWEVLSFDISSYSSLLHNALRTDMNFIRLVIYPLPPSQAVLFQIKDIQLRFFTDTEKLRHNKRIRYQARRKQPGIDLYKYLKYTSFICAIKQINVLQDYIDIRGTIPLNNQLFFLCEIPMFSEFTTIEFGEKIIISPDELGNFTVRVPRLTNAYGCVYDSLYSRWAIVARTEQDYSLASYAQYARNMFGAGGIMPITPRSKKGLGDFRMNRFESDLGELDISYITVNIRLNDFLCYNPDNCEDVISFEYNGKIYYVDGEKIREYDAIMQSAHKRSIIVSAIVLIYPVELSRDKKVGEMLEHPDYNTTGAYSMPDMTTPASLNLYAASIDFLASRYSRQDSLYGHIHRWIVHNEIDAGAIWTNAGTKELIAYIDIYVKSLRLIYLTTRKYNQNTEVFVPFTHYWKERFDLDYYAPPEMLELLLLYSKKEGDFKWGIAHHTYPEKLVEPKSWLDKVTHDYDTPMITFKNLEVLDAWVKQKHTFYQNQTPRSLILSEQNPNTRDYTQLELDKQAACLAYAWKKMQACTHIEAYIAHSWIDAHFEGGLKTGLRKYPNDESDPYGTKPAWYVFKALGTDEEDAACEFAKKIIGIENWDEIFNRENEK